MVSLPCAVSLGVAHALTTEWHISGICLMKIQDNAYVDVYDTESPEPGCTTINKPMREYYTVEKEIAHRHTSSTYIVRRPTEEIEAEYCMYNRVASSTFALRLFLVNFP